MTPPDPRTAPDDADAAKTDGHEAAPNEGVSAPEPAEGVDDDAEAGSAKG